MDCDFSHPPTDLHKGIELLSKAEAVMGSAIQTVSSLAGRFVAKF
jgi:hypothetical protein